MSNRVLSAVVSAVACAASVNLVSPQVASGGVWNSTGEADWNTPANWDNGIVPSTGWAFVDGAGAPTLASGTALFGGDAFIVYHAPLTLSGGSLKMTYGVDSNVFAGWGGANSRIKVNPGSTLDFWQMFVGGASVPDAPNPAWAGTVDVNGGNLVGTHLFVTDNSTMSIASGNVTLAGVFHLRDGVVTISGGTLSISEIALDGSGTVVTLAGGRINLGLGIYQASDGYVDFAPGSTGLFHVVGDTTGNTAASLLASGKVRSSGLVDPSAFVVTTDGAGSYISVVPEPASAAVLVAALLPVLGRRCRKTKRA